MSACSVLHMACDFFVPLFSTVCVYVSFYFRHIISSRGTVISISVASTVFTVRSCGHSENDSRTHRLLFSYINCCNCANLLSANSIPDCAGNIRRWVYFIMQFPRNFTSTHWTDKVQRNAVILFNSLVTQLCTIQPLVHSFRRIISILEWFLPDIVMLISAPAIYLVLRKLTAPEAPDVESAGSTDRVESDQNISSENANILKKIGGLYDSLTSGGFEITVVFDIRNIAINDSTTAGQYSTAICSGSCILYRILGSRNMVGMLQGIRQVIYLRSFRLMEQCNFDFLQSLCYHLPNRIGFSCGSHCGIVIVSNTVAARIFYG